MFYNIKKNFQNTCIIKNKALNLQKNKQTLLINNI